MPEHSPAPLEEPRENAGTAATASQPEPDDRLTVATTIRAKLRQAAWRFRRERAIGAAVYAALAAHVVLIPWLVLKALWPLPPLTYAVAVLAALVAGAVIGFARPLPLLQVARELDRRLALEERLQSALEFAGDFHRSTVRALMRDVAETVARRRLTDAFSLRPPRAARYLLLALGLGALLLWGPGLPIGGLEVSSPSARVMADAKASVPDQPERPTASASAPEPAPPMPLQRWEEVAYKDSSLASRPADFMRFVASGDEHLGLLDPALGLPRLQPAGDSANKAAGGGASASVALDFEPRRASQQEAAARLGELERLWGTPASPHAKTPGQESEQREQPEESGPANEPGEETSDRAPSDGETVEVNELHPDEERLSPQSDRFASLPEGSDAASSDLPPWPKGGPGEGQEDDSQRDNEGTGRSSGKPGSGFSQSRRGAPGPRIGAPGEEELRLRSLRRAGPQDSYETDLPALSTDAQALLRFQQLRARYTRRAEQTLSEEWIPFDSRAQVKRYFRAIEARQ